jgi:hypothetical protein
LVSFFAIFFLTVLTSLIHTFSALLPDTNFLSTPLHSTFSPAIFFAQNGIKKRIESATSVYRYGNVSAIRLPTIQR